MSEHPLGLEAGKKIIVTGIGSRLGLLVARRLHRIGEYQIVGIDRRPTERLPKDIEHLRVDIRSKRARDAFRHDVAALVHVGLLSLTRGPVQQSWNLLGTARLLEYCEAYGVPKVVVLSSADVYGARPDNQQFLSEDAPLLGASEDPALHELITADMQATSFFWRSRDAHVDTVVLRPVHVLGALRNPPSNYLRLKKIPILWGFDPMMQVIHERDVVEAIVLALKPGAHGVFNIPGPGQVPLSVLVRELDSPVRRMPYLALRLSVATGHRFHLTRFAPADLAHLRFVGMVDGTRAQRELGFRPRYSLRETIRAVYDSPEI